MEIFITNDRVHDKVNSSTEEGKDGEDDEAKNVEGDDLEDFSDRRKGIEKLVDTGKDNRTDAHDGGYIKLLKCIAMACV